VAEVFGIWNRWKPKWYSKFPWQAQIPPARPTDILPSPVILNAAKDPVGLGEALSWLLEHPGGHFSNASAKKD
jgi:hypothetical protein